MQLFITILVLILVVAFFAYYGPALVSLVEWITNEILSAVEAAGTMF